ncbi:MAG: hypothetical protein J6R40_03475, partial [Clostridia bacterium]|nr:hypothetical protein [Clostridia bacterium]
MTDLDKLGAKKLRQDLLARSGYVIFAFVVLFNVAFRAFTHAGLSWQTVWHFTADCVLYVVSVYVTFCALADTARRDAICKDAYLSAYQRCRLACEAAKPKRHLLCSYCLSFALADKEERKKEYLGLCGISYAEYEEHYAQKSKKALKEMGLAPWQIRLLRKVRHLKPLKIDRASLFEMGERKKGGRLFVNPRASRARRYRASLLPTTLFALFSAQIVFAVSAHEDMRTLFVELLLR